jgi:hypothetical protein
MTYQWGKTGPGFQYPSCWRTENLFLKLRAAALIVLALVVLGLILTQPAVDGLARLRDDRLQGDTWPHTLMVCLYLALAVADLWTASQQRWLKLMPGQPTSLVPQLGRHAVGSSPGAAWLREIVESGHVPPDELRGPYRGLLAKLAPQLVYAPAGLQDYLSARVTQMLLALGLGVVLLATWLLVRQPVALTVAALVYAALAVAVVVRSRWVAQAASGPRTVAVVVLLAAACGVGLALLTKKLPPESWLLRPGFSMALALALLCLLVIEGLGLLAGCAGMDAPATLDAAGKAKATADVGCNPERLMQEVERELHRYWTEGIANRRYAWDATVDEDGLFNATVLEESQPMLSADQRDGILPPTGRRRVALQLLAWLGFLMTLAGGLLWAGLAQAHLQNAGASLAAAASSLVLVVGGRYAIRVGHFLWSRIEVESALLMLEVQSATRDLKLQRLRWSVLRVRSVFYTMAPASPRSRSLLALHGDEAAARRSAQQVHTYAERPLADDRASPASVTGSPTPVRMPPAPHMPPRVPPHLSPAPSAPTSAAPRFCPSCGTPVVAQSRFCYHCGRALH